MFGPAPADSGVGSGSTITVMQHVAFALPGSTSSTTKAQQAVRLTLYLTKELSCAVLYGLTTLIQYVAKSVVRRMLLGMSSAARWCWRHRAAAVIIVPMIALSVSCALLELIFVPILALPVAALSFVAAIVVGCIGGVLYQLERADKARTHAALGEPGYLHSQGPLQLPTWEHCVWTGAHSTACTQV
jgi:hypothetical protein